MLKCLSAECKAHKALLFLSVELIELWDGIGGNGIELVLVSDSCVCLPHN